MDDDIDIEEHDVLDNPIIRNIFPDISVIKEEIAKYYEDAPNVKQEPEITTATEKISEDPVIQKKVEESVKQVQEQSSAKNHYSRPTAGKFESKNDKWKKSFHGTKIIPGSKSESKLNKPFLGTKIILGTNPCKTVEQIRDEEIDMNKEQNISLDSVARLPKLLLQDIGEYIYLSNRYCKECKTLYPSKSDLQDHKLKFHSTKAQNKPARPVTSKIRSVDIERNKITCSICGSYFSCKSSLSRHYKNIHKKKNSNAMINNANLGKNSSRIATIGCTNINKCDLIDRKSNENYIITKNKHLNVKLILDETKSSKKVKKPLHNIQTKQNAALNKIKCSICGLYFSNRANLNRHYKNIHHKKISANSVNKLKLTNDKLRRRETNSSRMVLLDKSTRSQIKHDKPDTKNICFHCDEQFSDKKCLIEHMYTILESKQYSKQKCSKILTMVKEKCNPTTETINTAHTKMKPIRMKDKLIFENQDSDGSDSSSSDIEKVKKYHFESKLTLNKTEKLITLEKEQCKSITTDDVSQSIDQPNPKALKNKRKYDMSDNITMEKEQTESITTDGEDRRSDQSNSKRLRNKRQCDSSDDDDTNSTELSFLNTNETNQSSHESNSLNKKRRLESEHVDSDRTTSKDNNRNSKPDKSNEHKIMKVKGAKSSLLSAGSKNKTVELQYNKMKGNSSQGPFVYECIYCSFLCPSPRGYCMHMFSKHKLEKVSRINKTIFDIQCKYCSRRVPKKSRNRHIRLSHYDLFTKPYNDEVEDCLWRKETAKLKNPAFKNVESFVLKSIVYKCTKCDIHFLSSCVVKDHEKHMEMLINWKCSICKKIFKKHDKHLHLKQHKFSKTVNVCQFDQSELSRLLYNCTKCAIHFTEERYLKHFSKCDHQTTDSVYCKNCDILIDKNGHENHEALHRTGKNTEDMIVITGDIITKSLEKLNSLEESTSREIKFHQEKDGIKTVKNRAIIYSPTHCLTFCQTCKCYLSDIAITRKSHVEGSCSKMVKYTCPTCGLVFTNKTINTHRDHHKKEKGLNLQNFEFFDLNGIQINPPIPEYPSCNNCEVIFVGRNAVNNHVCSETEYLTCEICNVKLSENAFKLHMNFHIYRMPNEKVNQSLYDVPRKAPQRDIEPVNQLKTNPTLCTTMPNNFKQGAVLQTEYQEHNDGVDNNTEISCVTLCNATLKEKTYHSPTGEGIESPPIIPDPSINTAGENEHKDQTDNARSIIIHYTCQSCNISVDTYDKVIQHCQNHFNPNPTIPSSLKMCSKCSLKFEIETYEIHQKLNLSCDIIQVLAFDPTYFTSDNNTWIRHVFASVTPSIPKQAIENSMYKHECRIKMEVIQQGPSNLTVYKCFRCGIFIDPDCLVSHIRDGCSRNIRKHPCSICGLPFISSLSRTKHEKIHRRHENVRLKSYKILLINSEIHSDYNTSILNAMTQYILYQCRTCDVIVDKSQRNDHKCNFKELRKCPTCKLILHQDDFESHISKHSDLTLYNADNIKVILFGNKNESNKTLSSSFNGVVADYKLYICGKCDDCENDDKLVPRHVCTFDDSKWKCPKCGYYISARSIKKHIKKHEVDSEFKTDNFRLVNFGSTKDKDSTKETYCGYNNKEIINKKDSDSEEDSAVTEHKNNSENSTKNDQDKEAIAFYKCACGLHYMDEMSAKNHIKLCCPKMKIIRQNCSKCSLTFNPKELFAHILAHHGDKNKTFIHNVIEVKGKT